MIIWPWFILIKCLKYETHQNLTITTNVQLLQYCTHVQIYNNCICVDDLDYLKMSKVTTQVSKCQVLSAVIQNKRHLLFCKMQQANNNIKINKNVMQSCKNDPHLKNWRKGKEQAKQLSRSESFQFKEYMWFQQRIVASVMQKIPQGINTELL